MQVRYQFQATPVRALVAMLIVVAALLAAGASGYSFGRASSESHAVAANGQSVRQPGSAAAGQVRGVSAFPHGPADRAAGLLVARAGGQAQGESGFPYGPSDRAGR